MSMFDFLSRLYTPQQSAGGFAPAGLLDDPALRQQAVTQGLLATGASLLDAAAPSPVHRPLGQAIARSIAAGRAAGDDTMTQALRTNLAGLELQKGQAELDAAKRRSALIEVLGATPPKSWTGTPDQWRLRVEADPDSAVKLYDPAELQRITYRRGSQEVTATFDPRSGTIGPDLATGPAFAPQQPDREAGAWETVTLPNGQQVQHNRRTGQYSAMPAPQQPQQISPGDVAGPLLAKIARGETLTPAEQQALDTYQKMSPLDRLLMQSMPGGTAPAAGAAAPAQSGGASLYGPGSSAANPVAVKDAGEAAKLPPGTYFKTPDGRVIRRK